VRKSPLADGFQDIELFLRASRLPASQILDARIGCCASKICDAGTVTPAGRAQYPGSHRQRDFRTLSLAVSFLAEKSLLVDDADGPYFAAVSGVGSGAGGPTCESRQFLPGRGASGRAHCAEDWLSTAWRRCEDKVEQQLQLLEVALELSSMHG